MNSKALLIVSLGFSVLCSGCGESESSSAMPADSSAAPLRVKAALPQLREFEFGLTLQGTVFSKNTAQVAARVGGNLDKLFVDEGDKVVAGETKLFQTDPVNAENRALIATWAVQVAKSGLLASEANLDKIVAEADKAEADFARFERLHRDGRVTDNEFELRQTQHKQARAAISAGKAQVTLSTQQVSQAEAQLAIARKELSDVLIVAPISGMISTRAAEAGEFVPQGRTVLSIVDTDALEVSASLPAQYYASVIPGKTPMRVRFDGVDAPKDVVVAYRSPVVDTTLRTFEVKGDISAETTIAPGMMADVTIVFTRRKGLGVPSGAVLVRDSRRVVFAVREGKAVKLEVATGLQTGGYTEITSGLESGDVVIFEGHTLVREGQTVTVM